MPRHRDHLKTVAAAVWSERRLRMRYESWASVSEREVDPLGLVLKAGVWYLVARHGRELRTLRLSGIQRIEPATARFTRPRNFDLAAWWAKATRRFEEGVYRGVATLRVSPAGLAGVRRFSAVVAQAADRSAGQADGHGWCTVTIPIESVTELRDRLRRTALRVLALYAT